MPVFPHPKMQKCTFYAHSRPTATLGAFTPPLRPPAGPTHELAVIRHGIGYSREMTNFYSLLNKYGISEEKVFKAFELKIKAFAYDEIHPMLLEFLKENGVQKAEKYIKHLGNKPKKYLRMLNRAPK